MKHYLNLIPLYAKVHRRQNKMTLVCIILAVFLVTAIFSMADMELRSQKIRAIANYGNWHITVKNLSKEDAALIAARPDVAASSWYEVLNYRLRDHYTIGGKQAAVCGVEQELVTSIMGGLAAGEFPQTDREILVTQNAASSLGITIGDTVTLAIPTGEALPFTVSGFGMDTVMTDKADAVGVFMRLEPFGRIYQAVKERELTDSDLVYYVQFQEHVNMEKAIDDIRAQYGLAEEDIAENTALLGVLGFSSDSYMRGIYIVAFVLFLLVMAAGVLMIASSMNSNIAQRTSFFGMLRCIGADRRQVMRFVRLEALNWCKIAVPVGVGIGIVLTWAMCAALRFLSAGFFSTMPVFGVSGIGITMGVVVGVLTVLLAAQSPAKKASSVSPLAAVSGSAGQVRSIHRAANTKWVKIDTALGLHHAKQNKKNLVLMAGSYAISIVLFLCFASFLDFMHHAIRPLQPYTADISIVSPDNTCSVPKELAGELQSRAGVKRVYGRMFAYDIPATIRGEEKKVMLISYEDQQFWWVETEGWASDKAGLEQVIQDEAAGYVLAAVNPQNSITDGETVSTALGDLTVAATLEQCPFDGSENTVVLVCSETLFTKLTGENAYTIIDVQLKAGTSEAEVEALRSLVGTAYTFSDQRLGNQEAKGAYYSFALFIYGFLAIIALIAAMNIVNSISMSVSARFQQYGAMRAVGMDVNQLRNMVCAETYTYALSGMLAGVMLGLPLHRFLWNMLIFNRWLDPWKFPVVELTLILVLVAVTCVLAVRGPVKRIASMSIVDVIAGN